MTRDIWVISDTHLNHFNILKFTDEKGKLIRPFGSVKEMDEYILDRWNSVVKPGDKVYHLGDVTFGNKDTFKSLWPKFNGSKRLIVGNHDDIRFLSSGGFFQKVYMWRMFPEFNLILSHVPLHQSCLKTWGQYGTSSLNVHGHIHQNKSPDGPYFNVSVEAVNYTPVHIEELASIANENSSS